MKTSRIHLSFLALTAAVATATVCLPLNGATAASAPTSTASPATPGHIPAAGVDTAGAFFFRNKAYSGEGWKFPAWRDAIRDLNAGFLMDHYFDVVSSGRSHSENRERTFAKIDTLGEWLGESGVEYIFNLENANWLERKRYVPGENLFEPWERTHLYLLPDEILAKFSKMPGMKAVCYDEIEHMQLTNSRFMKRDGTGDYPALVDTTAMQLPEAYDALVARMVELHDHHARFNIATSVELVWPVMHHLFARAGWAISPKILKESWTPVPVAMALGAAVEYAGTGTDVWINPDLWFRGHYPGHSVDAMRSALVYGHWLGASRVYQENMDFVNTRDVILHPDVNNNIDYSKAVQGRHHPDADGWLGSLVQFSSDKEYQLTPYGVAFRDYARDYRPHNPVPYTWRDARCRVAIVRFEDSNWGQRQSWFRDDLLGSKIVHSTPDTEAWFGIWHRLSHGVIPKEGLSYHINSVKNSQMPRFFVPAPPTLVFDHRVGDEHPDFDFKGAKILFLTGTDLITDATHALVRKRVRSGLTVATLPHLAPPDVRKKFEQVSVSGKSEYEVRDGSGRWIVARDFLGPQVAAALKPLLSPPNELQHDFGKHKLVIREVDTDRVGVWLDGQRRYTPPAQPSKRAVRNAKGDMIEVSR
ncbi:hypothetical protein Ga0100231_012120 [Opitutaceae bacterium TAV4]|nr:hypothetical protein Ga0100231_012120 [Opitutaceae bacterium TAV4]RRK02092.1 hypothetical protein Ga0100230_002480 [Opitutaceae bacterium TAV3]